MMGIILFEQNKNLTYNVATQKIEFYNFYNKALSLE